MRKYCIYQRNRTKKYKPILYCKNLRQQVTWEQCKNCSMVERGRVTTIKNKSNKLSKKEKNRFSIVQEDMSYCFFCDRQAQSIHELIGGMNRQTSIKWGLCVGACIRCHRILEDNEKIKQKYRVIGQNIFEKKYSHELFMQEFKMDYKEKKYGRLD